MSDRLTEIEARLSKSTPWAMLGTGNHPADADLITHAPKDLRDLLAVAKAARRFSGGHGAVFCGWCDGSGDCPARDLDDALARLDGGTP